MPVVVAENLGKTYKVADKLPGLAGTLRHFFRRRFRYIQAVRQVNFTIEPGEIVGFLGPNGAGKTTTLKMLTGLIHPSEGKALVHGHVPFNRQAAFLRHITLVMGQKQQMIWDLPPLDSLRINAAVYEIPDDEAQRRIDELADMLGLSDELTRPVRKLSLGERMKCELLAALIHYPKVLFLDEPTLGLDVNAQTSVRQFLRQYNQKHGAAILLTSHYMADITALCERVIVIHRGSLMYDGSLNGVVRRLAPLREVDVELGEPMDQAALASYGDVASVNGRHVQFLIQRDQLTRMIDRLLTELNVIDLTVTDPPIEQVVGRLFDEGIEEVISEK